MHRPMRSTAVICATAGALAGCAGTAAPRRATPAADRGSQTGLAVVAIDASIGGQRVQASGFVIDGASGLVLTSAHGIWGARSLRLTTALGILHGRIVARAPCDDMAVVATEPRLPGFVALPAAPPARPAAGQLLRALGRVVAPGAYGMAGIPVRPAGAGPTTLGGLPAQAGAIPLDSGLVPAVSGGPVVDAAGRLVGMALTVPGARHGLLVPWQRLETQLRRLRPGHRAVYAGWGDEYRCAPRLQAYARATFPGYRDADARLNAPVPATRVPGTGGLDG